MSGSRRIGFLQVLLALLFLRLPTHFATAQSINLTLTQPSSPVTVANGHDFATDVIGNQWNMDRLRDIAYDVGFSQPTATNGVWTAHTINPIAYFFPLSPGFLVSDYPIYPSYYDQGTPYGPLNPVDGNRFTRLAIRMSMLQSARDFINIGWTTNSNQYPSQNMLSVFDGELTYNNSTYFYAPSASGFRIYDLDMRGQDSTDQRNPAFPLIENKYGQPWGSMIYGFNIQPSTKTTVSGGFDVSVDWIRLYDPSTSPIVDIQWTTMGIPNDAYTSIQLFIDTNNSGYDGDFFMGGIANDGDYPLRTGGLPPGDYYVYLKAVRHENGGFTEIARSAYSPRIHITQSPSLVFTDPNFTTGVDYATAELGNPWDFSAANDVFNTAYLGNIQYYSGMMDAVAEVINGVSDAQMYMNLQRNGISISINPKKYRYLTFRMKADISGYQNIYDRVSHGFDAKLTWWNNSLASDGTYSQDIPLLEDWHSYSIDLWDPAFVNPRYRGVYAQAGWKPLTAVTTLRFDPIEASKNVRIWIDDMKLCANSAPANGYYTIRWNVQDTDSTNVSIKLFYGYYNALGYNEYPSPILVTNQAPGAGSFLWDMRRVGSDAYYIRGEVSAGSYTNSTLSKVPLSVEGVYPRMNVKKNDPTVYWDATGNWAILYSGSLGFDIEQWGFPGSVPVAADYDGDGKTDLGVFYNVTGRWYIRSLTNGVLAWNFNWGWPGAKPVPGDYDGDGKADLAVFDTNLGNWYIYSLGKTNVLLWNFNWGWRGAYPVPGDYDGDGKSDLAVLDQNTGRWYIYSPAKKKVLLWNFNWGWPNCTFVPGDYDGDGASDMAIFDRNTSKWFIYSPSKGKVLSDRTGAAYWYYNWGFAGVTPIAGDYDNDGKDDLTVYDERTGMWYFLFSGGGYDISGPWGGPGYKPVVGNFDGQ